jgi:hypothetical protein
VASPHLVTSIDTTALVGRDESLVKGPFFLAALLSVGDTPAQPQVACLDPCKTRFQAMFDKYGTIEIRFRP